MNFQQIVTGHTHKAGLMLDAIFVKNIKVSTPLRDQVIWSDHAWLSFTLDRPSNVKPVKERNEKLQRNKSKLTLENLQVPLERELVKFIRGQPATLLLQNLEAHIRVVLELKHP